MSVHDKGNVRLRKLLMVIAARIGLCERDIARLIRLVIAHLACAQILYEQDHKTRELTRQLSVGRSPGRRVSAKALRTVYTRRGTKHPSAGQLGSRYFLSSVGIVSGAGTVGARRQNRSPIQGVHLLCTGETPQLHSSDGTRSSVSSSP